MFIEYKSVSYLRLGVIESLFCIFLGVEKKFRLSSAGVPTKSSKASPDDWTSPIAMSAALSLIDLANRLY